MFEVACEPNGECNVDQRSFKGYLARWMAATIKMAPFTYDLIMPKLQASAQAAAAQCSGGADGNTCGLQWTQGAKYDGSFGVGEQMSAMEVIQSNLITKVAGPVTNNTGGTSKGNPSAGTGGDNPIAVEATTITTGDKAGAGFLTVLILVGMVGGAWWMVA
jgi:mannan endo-1,6-alpha-mannosidase